MEKKALSLHLDTQLLINILHNLLNAIYFDFVFLPTRSFITLQLQFDNGFSITMKSTTGTTTTISMYVLNFHH